MAGVDGSGQTLSKMKKTLILLITAIVAFGASAKFRWGPTAGLTVTDLFWSQRLITTNQLAGYNIGVMGEVMIPGIGFGIDLALKYNWRGATVHFEEQKIWSSDGIGKTDLRFHTLQVPVNLRFKWTRMNGIENIIAPIAFGGPTFNFNLKTNDKRAINYPTASVGLQCGLGAELLKRYQITAGYQWDVTYDVETKKLDNFTGHIDGWFVNLAVLF